MIFQVSTTIFWVALCFCVFLDLSPNIYKNQKKLFEFLKFWHTFYRPLADINSTAMIYSLSLLFSIGSKPYFLVLES